MHIRILLLGGVDYLLILHLFVNSIKSVLYMIPFVYRCIIVYIPQRLVESAVR